MGSKYIENIFSIKLVLEQPHIVGHAAKAAVLKLHV